MQDTKAISIFYHLELTSSTQSLPDFTTVPSIPNQLVHRFSHLFQEPQGLSPVSGAFRPDSI